MSQIIHLVRTHKTYSIITAVIVFFLLARFVLLQKPTNQLTYTVKRENLVDTVQVSATYTTASQTQVFSPTSGVITDLYVSNGQEVSKGDPLFHIESTATQDEINTAYANYETALNAVNVAQQNQIGAQAQLEKDRQAVLVAQGAVDIMNANIGGSKNNPATGSPYTQNDINAINSTLTSTRETFSADEKRYTQAGTTIAAAQAQLTAAQTLYTETQAATVTAPASGTIANLLQKVGDSVSGSNASETTVSSSTETQILSTASQQPVLVITNFSDPYLTAQISEDYATRIATGQHASIVFDSLKNKTFSGTVEGLDSVGTAAQGIVTYNARIIAHSIPDEIKPNMTALVTIETLRKNNILDVPNSALIAKNGKTYVENAKNNSFIEVETGVKGISKTEIINGISEGTVIDASPE